jgi:hypothetical protein
MVEESSFTGVKSAFFGKFRSKAMASVFLAAVQRIDFNYPQAPPARRLPNQARGLYVFSALIERADVAAIRTFIKAWKKRLCPSPGKGVLSMLTY